MRLLISTGEVSGDLQGSFLVKALLKEAACRSIDIEIMALGGRRMEEAGAELIADTTSIGAIGFWEALPFILPTLRAQSKVDLLLKQRPPDVLVLIDYMGPNIRLGNKVKALLPSVPIAYYIAPQEWVWRLGDEGTTDLIGFTDKILAIFQSEAEFYSRRGGNVTWVGHPMLDTLKALPSRKEACINLKISEAQQFVLLLPASRSQELRYLMPTLMKVAALIQKQDASIYILVLAGLPKFEKVLSKALISNGVKGKVIPANETDSLKSSLFAVADLALAKSGTINMELALNKIPQIVGYKVSRITAFVARKILRFNVEHISPVNLLLKERLVPEFVQEEFKVEFLSNLAIEFLQKKEVRSRQLEGYERLRKKLGSDGVTIRAAKQILDLAKK